MFPPPCNVSLVAQTFFLQLVRPLVQPTVQLDPSLAMECDASIVIRESICPIKAAKPRQNVFYVLLGLTLQQVVYPQSPLASFVRLDIFQFKVLDNVWIVVQENIRQVLGHQQFLTASCAIRGSIQVSLMHLHFQNVLPAMLAVSVMLDAVCA